MGGQAGGAIAQGVKPAQMQAAPMLMLADEPAMQQAIDGFIGEAMGALEAKLGCAQIMRMADGARGAPASCRKGHRSIR